MINKTLYPFAALYGLVTSFRNLLFDKGLMRSSEFDIPVINVGNLSAGGNGKTPHVEYIVNLLIKNYKVAVLSRGYGRKTKGFKEVLLTSDSAFAGDEPLQIKQKFGDAVKVFVGEKRVDAILEILKNNPDTEVIILDDAFQHRAVKAGLNLLLTNYEKLFTEDILLPVGRLREGKNGAFRADAIVVSKCPVSLSKSERESIEKSLEKYKAPVYFSHFIYDKIQPVVNPSADGNPTDFFLVTGIAKPALFDDYAASNLKVTGRKFYNDHHRFRASDIEFIEKQTANTGAQAVLTTEKDAVRFAEIYNKRKFDFPVYTLPVKVEFTEKDAEKFDRMVIDFVKENNFTKTKS